MPNTPTVTWLARIALLVFGVWTATIVLEHGYTGFITGALADDWAGQVFVDLVIALSIVMVWMARDAKQRGATVWPYLLLTLTLGSIGPLIYLSARPGSDPADDQA